MLANDLLGAKLPNLYASLDPLKTFTATATHTSSTTAVAAAATTTSATFTFTSTTGSEVVYHVAVYFDARKVMHQTNHTEVAYKILNNKHLRQVAQWQQSILIYVGKDDHYFLLNHCKQMFDEIDALEQGMVDMVDVDGRQVRVKFWFIADGAARRSLFGVSSAASTYPMSYNALRQADVSKLNLFGPIDRRAESMRLNEPPEEDDAPMSHKQRVAHASKHYGIYGSNCIRRDLEASPPDEFHQGLLMLPRVLAFTYRAIAEDVNSSVDDYETHLRVVVGLRHNIRHVEGDGRIVLKMYGNDCRILLENLDKILPEQFMSLPEQREAILEVWEAAAVIFRNLKNFDPQRALTPEECFHRQHMFLLKAHCVFGEGFVTPTLREIRDQNPFFTKLLSDLGLTLADVSVDSFEAWHRLQKKKLHADLMSGGKGHKIESIKRLLVRPQCV